LRVEFIAADSMGVRSMATVVNACGHRVGVDLGASLAPRRYGLPPHRVEIERLEKAVRDSLEALASSNIVLLTHYHYDHYLRDYPEKYSGKILLVKHPTRNINYSQRRRSWVFLKKLGVETIADVKYADASRFEFGRLTIEFSPPVWHGEEGTKVGWVVMARLICGDSTMVFASDVQGPVNTEALEILYSWSKPRPEVVYLSGPPTYFAGYKVRVSSVERGLVNLEELVKRVAPDYLVVDHHLLRDLEYDKHLARIREAASLTGTIVLTAAEFMGKPVEQLEARRTELWEGS